MVSKWKVLNRIQQGEIMIGQTQACDKLYMIVSDRINNLKINTGLYSQSGGGAIRKHLRVHFTGSVTTDLTPDSWKNSKLEPPNTSPWKTTKK